MRSSWRTSRRLNTGAKSNQNQLAKMQLDLPRAAFAAMPRTEFLRCPAPWGSPALKLDRPVCPLRAVRQAGGDCQSLGSLRRVQMPRHRRGAVGLRAQAGDGSLRDEFEKMLGSSGRDQGLKGMKAPKGSIEWLKQQQAKDKARNVSPAASPTAGRPTTA